MLTLIKKILKKALDFIEEPVLLTESIRETTKN